MNKKQIINRLKPIKGHLKRLPKGWEIDVGGQVYSCKTLREVGKEIKLLTPEPKIGRPKKNNTQIWFPCPNELHSRLRKEAREKGTTLSKLIVRKLENKAKEKYIDLTDVMGG
jgi:hypothetical protein